MTFAYKSNYHQFISNLSRKRKRYFPQYISISFHTLNALRSYNCTKKRWQITTPHKTHTASLLVQRFYFVNSIFTHFSPSFFCQLASISACRSQMLANLVHFAHSMFGLFFFIVHEIVLLVAFCVACKMYLKRCKHTHTHAHCTRKEISQFRIS